MIDAASFSRGSQNRAERAPTATEVSTVSRDLIRLMHALFLPYATRSTALVREDAAYDYRR